MSLRRRLITGLAWTFAGSWTEQAFNFAIFILLARLLGAEAFGFAMMGIVIVIFAEFLVRETVTESLIQLETVEDGHKDAVFWLLGGFSLALVAVLVLSADVIASLYGQPDIADFLVWLSPVILFIGFSGVPVAGLRRDLNFKSLAIRATLGVIAGGIVGISMALKGYGAWSLIGQRLAQVFVNNIFVWFAHPFTPGWRAKRSHVREVLQFGAKMIGLRATELISVQTPTVVIGVVLGPTVVGFYTIAWRVVEILSVLITTPLRMVAQPVFAHMQRGAENVGKLLNDLTEVSTLIAFATFFGLAVIAEPTITVLFGTSWLPAVPVLQVLCLLGVYLSIERLQQAVCLALGHAGSLFALSTAEALLGLITIIWVSQYGVVAIAVVFTMRYLLLWPFRFWIVRKATNIDMGPYVKLFAIPLLASLVMVLVILGWQTMIGHRLNPVFLLATSVGLGGLTYLGLASVALRDRLRHAKGLMANPGSTDRTSSKTEEA